MRIELPKDFVWGAATSAYQIEGAYDEDGRGESIWDRFCRTPGKIADGTSGDRACDHYHRFAEDVALIRDLGLRAYRFSIAWPRIQPTGSGAPNAKGLDFYDRLVDALLGAGIAPWPTLYHWDLPQALEDRGGWASRATVDRFGEYAAIIGRRLGDRVRDFIVLNEPQIFAIFGYLTGEHAPGATDPFRFVAASHHANLAHGRGVDALRAAVPKARIGTSLQLPPVYAASDSPEDRAAAARFDALMNRWYLDPILLGRYPDELFALLSPLGIPIEPGDLDAIRRPIDFVGVNLYTRVFVRHDPETPLLELRPVDRHVAGARYTAMGWEVYPPGIRETLDRLRTEYGNPAVYVTENGSAENDVVEHGRVHDEPRVAYLRSHLAEGAKAIADGCDLRGWFVWSLLDNFEWAHGLRKRFGLVHVAYDTLARTPKDSALFYRDVVAAGGFDV